MRTAPIMLENYFVTELTLTANKDFDPEKAPDLDLESFKVTPTHLPDEKDKRHWQVTLRIQHQPTVEAPAPYAFALVLVGFFAVHPDVPEETIERVVKTNGSSMLYGAAREIVRSLTAQGPFGQVVLPSLSFYQPKPTIAEESVAAPVVAESPR
jgi:preprotein translocase subunit SecB